MTDSSGHPKVAIRVRFGREGPAPAQRYAVSGAYLRAVQKVVSGVEAARVTVALATQWREQGAGQGRGASGSGRK